MFKKNEIIIETMRGTGPGGQHRNRRDSCVRVTHIPTGISAIADCRSQHSSRRKAMEDLAEKVWLAAERYKSIRREVRRKERIENMKVVRVYNFVKGYVKDLRTKKRASVKNIVDKGCLDLLR